MANAKQVQDATNNDVNAKQEDESHEPVYHVIESVNKYAFTNGRKINRVRLVVKRFDMSDKPYMTFSVHIMNQSNTATVKELKAGKIAYREIREVVQSEPAFATVLKKCKKSSKKFLTRKQAKSLDQLLVKYGKK